MFPQLVNSYGYDANIFTWSSNTAIDRQDLTTGKTMDCIRSLSEGVDKSMTWDKKKHENTAFREQLLQGVSRGMLNDYE